ncbi:MAG: sodium-dependent transporter [archaeon]|nr:sodium-dependent transporter [archaeon]
MSERGIFNSKIGYILAASASAVGLGNIWRFPTEAATHGGGTFLVVYILIVIFFGFILNMTEATIGRMTRKSAIDAYESINPKSRIIGILGTWVPVIILPYYCVIGGWITGYMFGPVVGADLADPTLFGDFISLPATALLAVVFLMVVAVIIYMGVTKGVERISVVFMPIFIILLIVLTVYVLMQPGMADGLNYYLFFDWSKLNMDTFVSALGQAFFSLSIAMGIMITYGSYMKKEENVSRSTVQIAVIDTVIAIIAGLLIVPLAHVITNGTMEGGAGLVFIVLPQVFTNMAGGPIVEVVFFIMLFIAAITSAISIMEAITSTMIDRFHMSRHKAVCVLMVPMVIACALVSLGYGPLDFVTVAGMNILDTMDFISNNILMPIVAFMTCMFIGHFLGSKKILDEIGYSDDHVMRKIYPVMMKYICPVMVFIIFIGGLKLI